MPGSAGFPLNTVKTSFAAKSMRTVVAWCEHMTTQNLFGREKPTKSHLV